MFGSPEWMYSSEGFYPFPIESSCRVIPSANLNRTPSVTSNRTTWTWSGWFKKSGIGSGIFFFEAGTTNNLDNRTFIAVFSTGNVVVRHVSGGAIQFNYQADGLLRDPSAWYHLVVVYDSTEAVAADRVKVYINNEIREQDTSVLAILPSLNETTFVNDSTKTQYINSTVRPAFSDGNDGYLAELNFVDGQALDPTSFGEMKSGVWVPKEYTGTYGTNGFRLDFGNGAALGTDVSGNGNTFTPSGIDANDQMLDTPTNNFCTLNPVRGNGSNVAYSEGALRADSNSTAQDTALGTFATFPSKYYAEFIFTTSSTASLIGVQTEDNLAFLRLSGSRTNLTGTAPSSFTNNDIVGMAVDVDAGTIQYYTNGVANGGLQTITDYSGRPVVFAGNEVSTLYVNFGQDSSFAGQETRQGNTDDNGQGDFYYAPPAGYLALCTANLPDPVDAINPALDGSPQDYFNTVLWTGDASTQPITGVGFEPDWVWIKERSSSSSSALFDVTRGVTKRLYSDLNIGESTQANTLTSFDSDGFTTGDNTATNQSGETYVAWNWKASGAAVTNTDGTITSQVSAAPEVGFSVFTYTGNGVSGATIGHNLGVKPDLILTKNRDSAVNWSVYTSPLGATKKVVLNDTSAEITSGNYVNTEPTSTVMTVSSSSEVSASGDAYVAYAFASVEGFSKIGTYTGNGSTDGPFLYCGFRPAYVLIKSTTTTSNWNIVDGKRNGYNGEVERLFADIDIAELSGDSVDLLSNGFKLRATTPGLNANLQDYLFMAFAENPFKYANAR